MSRTKRPALRGDLEKIAADVESVIEDYRWAQVAEFRVENDEHLVVSLEFEVALPSGARRTGVSRFGVRSHEPVYLFFRRAWPHHAPRVALRGSFCRDLPHVNPYPNDGFVYPCLYPGGKTDDLLHQRAGLFSLLSQIKDWLDRAAREGLYDEELGWEPIILDPNRGWILWDIDELLDLVDSRGACVALSARFSLVGKRKYCVATVIGQQSGMSEVAVGIEDEEFHGSLAYLVSGKASKRATFRDLSTVSSLDDVYKLASSIGAKGFLRSSIRTMLSQQRREASGQLLDFFIVLAVHRPVQLAGVETQYELLPFWIEYRVETRGEGTARASLLGHRQVVTPKFSARLSGVPVLDGDRGVAVVGCGSLGSKIAIHLAKAGVSPLVLLDSGRVEAHNVVRHGLTLEYGDQGKRKAEVLRHALKGTGASCEAISADVSKVLDAHDSRIGKARLTIDATASPFVRERFAAASTPVGDRLAHCALHAGGEVSELLIEGPGRNPRVDDLYALALDESSKREELRRRLFSEERRFRPQIVGQGCTSLTMTMSDAVASLHAASISSILMDHLGSRLPGKGEIWLSAPDESGFGLEWINLSAGETVVLEDGGWEVRILAPVCQALQAEMREFAPRETGGALGGHINTHLKRITVTRFISAPIDSRRGFGRFRMGVRGLPERVKRMERQSCGFLTFLGTWHSHPEGGGPSSIDQQTLERFAVLRAGPPFLMLIFTPTDISAMVEDALHMTEQQ